MTSEERVHFYGEILNTLSGSCFLWTYDPEGNLTETNCDIPFADTIFRHSASYDYMLEYSLSHDMPLVMSNTFGLVWGASFEKKADVLTHIHVIGPALTQKLGKAELDAALEDNKLTDKTKNKLLQMLPRLPVFNITHFFSIVIGLEYCVSGIHLSSSDISLQNTPSQSFQRDDFAEEEHRADRNLVYSTEQKLLQAIRDGNMNPSILQSIGNVFTGNQRLSSNHLQHAKLSQVQFVVMCSRAAIEGGLSPEVAYTRNDAYIQNIENAKSVSEVTHVGTLMYNDFVEMVHKQKSASSVTKPIRSCCDYIQVHLGEKISAGTLAHHVGYANYYLSKMFRQQMGVSINQYIKNMRIERAKFLLANTNDSIQQICDNLGFSNRNYFTQVFIDETGTPPAAYRKENQHL